MYPLTILYCLACRNTTGIMSSIPPVRVVNYDRVWASHTSASVRSASHHHHHPHHHCHQRQPPVQQIHPETAMSSTAVAGHVERASDRDSTQPRMRGRRVVEVCLAVAFFAWCPPAQEAARSSQHGTFTTERRIWLESLTSCMPLCHKIRSRAARTLLSSTSKLLSLAPASRPT